MPNSFNLTSGANVFACDIQGNVSSGGAAFGTWSVDNNNQINVTDNAGNVTVVPTMWLFNAGNQLELHDGAGALVFNFHNDATVIPAMTTALAVLQVWPDQNGNTSFNLNGAWSLDNNFNLLFTPTGGKQSTLSGFLEDTASSEFVYTFISQPPAAQTYEFQFTGKWQQTSSGADVDFVYDKANSGTGQMSLPPGLNMDPVQNQLVYTYNTATHTGSLQLAGAIRLNSNFSITYVLDAQDDAGIKSTTFSIAAAIDNSQVGQGNLQLTVKQAGKDIAIQVGGTYHGAIAGVDLTVGFTYNRTVSGTTITDTVAFMGSISNPTGTDQFSWGFTLNGTAYTVKLAGQVALSKNTCLNAALNFTVNGSQVGVSAVFGIATNCGNPAPVSPKHILSNLRRRAIAQ